MVIVDRGSGAPVVLIPGIQGRWEWMSPAVDALASRCRVITFSLTDEPSARWPARGAGLDAYVEQIAQALDACGLERAAICGVSFGGLIAAAFALRHTARVSGLALVSALPPSWQPDARARFYMRSPRLLMPLFVIGSLRLHREIAIASGGGVSGLAASFRHGWRALTAFPSPTRMAARAGLVASAGLNGLASIQMRTLIVTGEAGLDRVVPPQMTAEYARLWPHAATTTLPRTGHLGLITRAGAFAEILVPFVESCEPAERTNGAGLQTRGHLSERRVG